MHLLDVNVWLALAFKRHVRHNSAVSWFRPASGPCVFCRFTQAGFLRLASNPSALGPAAVSLSDARRAYDRLFADPRSAFSDEPSGIEAVWRSNTQAVTLSPKVWNDAYLAAFAQLRASKSSRSIKFFTRYRSIRVAILP